MLLVNTNRVKPGMVTAAPVLHPRRAATRLVERGVMLTEPILRRIVELKVPFIWTQHPLLEDLDGIVLSKVPEHRREIYDTIKHGFDDLQSHVITTDDYRRYSEVISQLTKELVGRDARAGDMAERLFEEGFDLAGHSANVAYLAVTVGMHLETYIVPQRRHSNFSKARDLTSLGVGAMLHDIGKIRCCAEVRRQHELSPNRHMEYEGHVRAGYEILQGSINPVARTIALNHHQRWDGSGWPDMSRMTHGRFLGGFQGRNIHVFARIVAAANLFDNLTAGGPIGRPALYALHAMQSERFRSWFDPMVLDAFLRYVPPFPTGTMVTLSDGRQAAVTAINPSQPCRPTVRPIDVSSDGEDINLDDCPTLHIREAQGVDVTDWLYELPPRINILEEVDAEPAAGFRKVW